ncbi:hypothetical protein CP556_21515 [Natrinema sp. CBA1119]|uniref:beta strand repeat-containing protein n=1 Tax=Natrinema sp. CBA1119 TaxID=1608465 RepID=UPI000BF7DE67|nr:surface glycoprotein [Natrinema sp. CBA1119]PGF14376.1 hypothetical protein CP556_21770 [Natrinema sp. CBA1119]PGF14440.1 hypothetical protein CP556_21515 [Natrinema sp. CBA1119]
MTGDNTTEKLRAVLLATMMVISVVAMTTAFAGSAAAATNVSSGNQDVVLGAEAQSLGTSTTSFTISETTDDFGGSGSGEITVPDGVTFNQTQSDLTVRQTSSGSLSNVRFTDSQTIKFDYSGFSSTSADSISFGQLYMDVSQDAGSSFKVDTRVGVNSQSLTITTHQASISGPSGSFGAASTGNNIGTVTVSTATVDGQIGNQTDLIIYANQSNGVTLDTSVDVASTITDNNDNVNESAATISEEKIVVPVTSDFAAGDSVDLDGLAVNLTADASDSALTVEATPASDTGGSLTSTTGNQIAVTKPGVSLGSSFDLAVGQEGQATGDTITVTSSANGDIGDGTNVTVMLNDSDVTFDTSGTVTATVNNVTGPNGETAESKNAPAVVNENNLTVNVSGDFEATDNVVFSGFSLNVTNQPADGTDVKVSAQTQSSPNGAVITSEDTGTFITLQRPDYTYNGDTVDVDNDGEDQNALKDITVASATDSDIADNTNITISIADGSGVTFDQSDSNTLTLGFDDTATQVNPAVINEQNVTVEVKNFDSSGEAVVFQNIGVNVTADATNTTLAVTTNTSDSEVTTVLSNNVVVVNEVSPTQIAADPDVSDGDDFTNGNDVSATKPQVTNTITGQVRLQDDTGANFGAGDMNLEIVSTPEGSSGASLNTSTVTTASDGTADFNFTAGDKTGDYVVNATIAGTSTGVNITYTSQSGPVADITVTNVEDAIKGTATNDKQTAVLKVQALDAQGNPVSSSVDTSFTISSPDAENFAVDNWVNSTGQLADGTATGESIDASTGNLKLADNGTAYVSFTDPAAEDVTMEVEYGSSSDSGTVTIYDNIGQVSLELNESSVIRGDTVQADATIKQSDGTVITVPDITVNFDDNSNSNTTVNSASADTNGDGVASVTVSADSAGTSTIDAVTNLKKGSATLTIEDPTLTVSTDVDSVTVGEETTVNTTVTYENNGSAVEGATLNVTGAGVDVADQTTDANGTAQFTVNASEAGDITVNATLAGTNMGQATITAEPAAQPDISVDYDVDSETVEVGENVTVTATVTNAGDAAGSADVTFNADGTEVENQSVDVDANNSTTVEFTTSFDSAGSHNVSINDLNATEITVQAPASFDVSYDVDKENITVGETLNVTATVENTGDLSGETTVYFHAAGDEYTNTTVSVDAGNSTEIVQEIYLPEEAGSYNVSVNDLEPTEITVEEAASDEPTVSDYANENGVVELSGLSTAIDDWRSSEIGLGLLSDVIDAWRSGESVDS